MKCRPIFKEERYCWSLKPFSWIFADIAEWKQVFRASGNGVFIKSFIMTSVYGLSVNLRPCAFIQNFFLCCKALLKFGVNQFSSIFSVPNSGTSFSSYWKRILSQMLFISTSANWFFSSVLLFRANFVLLETIIQIKVKPFLSSLSPTIGNHFLRIFFIYNPVD